MLVEKKIIGGLTPWPDVSENGVGIFETVK